MKLIRVVCDGPKPFVAAFETDGVVRKCAPILRRHLLGKTDDEAREIIRRNGWKAAFVN
jgi:hypothetical protein